MSHLPPARSAAPQQRVKLLSAAIVAAALAACGGGGGSEPASPSPTNGPANGPNNSALAITTQPAGQAVVAGDPASFSVAASGGAASLAYQWLRDGQAIAGATGASYTLDTPSPADDGASFTVTVTDGSGATVQSSAAVLSVRSPIQAQPAAQSAAAGASATFSVSASGSALSYQWQRDGADIAGATGASFTTGVLSAADNGAAFRVRVANHGVEVFSEAAVLTVGGGGGTATPEVRRLSGGLGFALALRSDGSVLVWGTHGTVATVAGTPVTGSAAKVVAGVSGGAAVVADSEDVFSDALVVDGAGQVVRWGYGDTLLTSDATPTAQPALSPAVAMARCTGTVPKVTIVLHADGSLWFGGTQAIAGISSVVGLSERGTSLATCSPLAVKSDGTVWSLNVNGAHTAVETVVQVGGLPAVKQVSCGGGAAASGYCLALAQDGSVWSWGGNAFGQLGDGTSGSSAGRTVPAAVAGLAERTAAV